MICSLHACARSSGLRTVPEPGRAVPLAASLHAPRVLSTLDATFLPPHHCPRHALAHHQWLLQGQRGTTAHAKHERLSIIPCISYAEWAWGVGGGVQLLGLAMRIANGRRYFDGLTHAVVSRTLAAAREASLPAPSAGIQPGGVRRGARACPDQINDEVDDIMALMEDRAAVCAARHLLALSSRVWWISAASNQCRLS